MATQMHMPFCECPQCVEAELELSRIDLCDIADWELSLEVELTEDALPSLFDHPVELPWQHAQYK